MKLIVGLGNPGSKYKNTRHNIGFMFIDYLKNNEDFPKFKYESKFKSDISSKIFLGEKTILIKPQTFMNLSGEALNNIISFYKIDINNIIIVYDDLSMNFGKIRFRNKGSSGGHNGIKSIIKYLNKDFKRIKIGIGLDKRYDVSNWVLSKFTEEELIDLENLIFLEVYKILKEKIHEK